jgi:glycosyltransferase involved in cell wall biosynthesis
MDADVELMGYQPNPYKFMARADVFVQSSVSEGSPYTLAEALALEVPVVATDCHWGPRERLLDGKAGELVPPRDVESFAEALQRVLSDPETARAKARVGSASLHEISNEQIALRYQQLLEQIAA